MLEGMELRRKRAYEPAEPSDGFRVLVDRLWPRGVSKEHAAIDLWAKDVAPSTALRQRLHEATNAGHDVAAAWKSFTADYRAELAGPSADALTALIEALQDKPVVTLVYSARDTAHNNVQVLDQILHQRLGG